MRKKVQNQQTSTIFSIISTVTILVNNQNVSYTLDLNMISNSDFESPKIPSNTHFVSISNGMDSWKCTDNCQIVSLPFMCSKIDARYCPMINNSQVLDTQSSQLYNISQVIPLVSNASYSFGFKWLPPQINTFSSKYMNVCMNDTIIFSIFINSTNSKVSAWNQEAMTLFIVEGNLTLMFQTKGLSDGYGIYIDDVFLKELIPNNNTNTSGNINITSNATNVTLNGTLTLNSTANQTIDLKNIPGYLLQYSFRGQFLQTINRYPGSRVFFVYLTNLNINLDRLQFYYFHNQNFTQYSLLLIKNTYFFLEEKGSILEIFAHDQQNSSVLLKNIFHFGQNIQKILMFKENYQNIYLQKKVQNGGGFVENQFNFFYYEIPFSILTTLIFFALFKLLCRYRFLSN